VAQPTSPPVGLDETAGFEKVSRHQRLPMKKTHTYSIFVRPPGGSELTVGTNFAFRTEQSGVTILNWWGVYVNSGTAGSSTVCNFTLSP
jgi:hypothetical protein